MNEISLSLREPIFDQLIADGNAMLRKTLGGMTMRKAEDAQITIKISVHLDQKNITDFEGYREITQPSFKHEINSVMQVKDKMTGQTRGEYELLFDDDGNPVYKNINDGQTSMFDENGNVVVEAEYTAADVEADSLLGLPPRGLPGKTAEASDDNTPFGWLMRRRDESMYIEQNAEVYNVRSKSDDKIILSSGFAKDDHFYIDPWKLQKHLNHPLICVTSPETGEGDEIEAIEIWCDDPDCGECIFSIARPIINTEAEADESVETSDEDEEYGYDKPEDEAEA